MDERIKDFKSKQSRWNLRPLSSGANPDTRVIRVFFYSKAPVERSSHVSDNNDLHAMRHSLAHITASAVKRLWPTTKFGVGPVVENGFYYDIDLGKENISDEDFEKIGAEMRKIIDENQKFERSTKSVDEAIKWAKDGDQPYKEELLNDLKREGTTSASDIDAEALGTESDVSKVDEVGFYTNGDFEDLCRGPHVESTGKVGAFKLMRVAGAYWRGDETKPQMQRLYGVAFATQEELDKHLNMLEEAKKRDHRKLGKEMDLFTFSPLVGSGLPLFTPKGTILRERLSQYSEQLRHPLGYQKVAIPHITKLDLYETSGHSEKFGDELFLVESQETSDKFAMKPMNCPHHTQIYASKPRSYRELPLKYMETTVVYRDEKSGELNGIERVRSATQDDSHVFCTREQVSSSVDGLIGAVQTLYDMVGMPIKQVNLSFRDDGDGYIGDDKLWDLAQSEIEEMAKKNDLEYIVDPGEAAFYGPKIDFIAEDAIGRTTQVATIQLDFVQPSRFELEYTTNEGTKESPVMIHCAMLGSIERFLSVYIEHTAGHFPFWLAPEQIRIVTVNDSVADYVAKIEDIIKGVVLMEPLNYNEINYTVDTTKESVGKKIRSAEVEKVPLTLIVGPKDRDAEQVSVRTQDGESKVALGDLAEYIKEMK